MSSKQVGVKRIPFVCSALTGEELQSGNRDVTRVYALLTGELGGCISKGFRPVLDCKSRHDFEDALFPVLESCQRKDQFLFYFSGHGDFKREQYCLKFGEKDLYPFKNLLNELEAWGIDRSIIIIDACHSGAVLGSKGEGIDAVDLKDMKIPKGVAVIASSRATQVSRELSDGSASVFTNLFCEAIESGLDGKPTKNNLITVEDVISYIHEKLETAPRYSSFPQRPEYQVRKAEREIWIAKNKTLIVPEPDKTEKKITVSSIDELSMLYEKTHSNRHPCKDRVDLDELDWESIEKFAKKDEFEFYRNYKREDLLEALKLYSPISFGGVRCLHKSAILCFHRRPEVIYGQAKSLFVIRSSSDPNFRRRDDVCGNLSYQVRRLVELVKQNNEKASYIGKDGVRREVEEIDVAVARELISNAVTHRDYELNGYVTVTLTPEALEIRSPGNFPEGVSWQRLIESPQSYPVDEAVSLYLSNLLSFEGTARGFRTFRQHIKKNGTESLTCTEMPGIICVRLLRRHTKLKVLSSGLNTSSKEENDRSDWLTRWGVANLAGFAFEKVFAKLVEDSLTDYVQEFFRDSFKSASSTFDSESLDEVLSAALIATLKKFLIIVQDELEHCGLPATEIRSEYGDSVSRFIFDGEVKSILGTVFDQTILRGEPLERRWIFLELPELPDDFDWDLVVRQYSRQVRGLIRSAPELRSIIEENSLSDAQGNTTEIPISLDISKYRDSLKAMYGRLSLSTIDYTSQPSSIRLWNAFVEPSVRESLPPAQYETPLKVINTLKERETYESSLSSRVLEQYSRRYSESFPTTEVLTAISGVQRAVVLGDPGSGKSTLLQYLALKWAEGGTDELPILIELRNYWQTETNNFLDFLHQERGVVWNFNRIQLHQYLQESPALVMFDGLDEVLDYASRSAVVNDIIRFAQQYPKVRILVTSRIVGYNPERLYHAEFRHLLIQPLDDNSIYRFIDRWYDLSLDEDSDRVRLKQRLKNAITESKAIRSLAYSPLLLTMMVILNRRQELPRNRVDLYDQASRVLLHQWDVENKQLAMNTYAIGLREKQEMLSLVAYEMQAGESGARGNLIDAELLTRILTSYLKTQDFSMPRENASLLIQQLRNRNFILCHLGSDVYGFIHRIFLEYFCALEIVSRFESKQSLTFEQLRDEVFVEHWQDERWEETLLLIMNMISSKFSVVIVKHLLELSHSLDAAENVFFVSKCLSEVDELLTNKEFVSEILERIKEIAQSPNKDERASALKELARRWRHEPSTLRWLKKRMEIEKDLDIRQTLLQEIKRGWKHDEDTLKWLKDVS